MGGGGGGGGGGEFQPIPVTAYVTMIPINDSCAAFSRQLHLNASSPAVSTTNMSVSNAARAAAVCGTDCTAEAVKNLAQGTAPLRGQPEPGCPYLLQELCPLENISAVSFATVPALSLYWIRPMPS